MRPSFSSTRRFSLWRSGSRNQDATSRASSCRAPPNASKNNAATCSASSSRSSLVSGEVIERLRQLDQVRKLARRVDAVAGALAEPVDPDAAQTELVCGRDVVEQRGRDVHVSLARRIGAAEELVPVTVRRLV